MENKINYLMLKLSLVLLAIKIVSFFIYIMKKKHDK
jgi:hypothetical protein